MPHDLPNQYELVRRLAFESDVEVYEVTNPARSGRFLIELVPPARGHGVSAARAQVDAAWSLQHPHVLPPCEIGTMPDGTPFVVSPCPEGLLLEDWLKAPGPADRDEVLAVLRGLADALAAAHRRGIAHGALGAEAVVLASLDGGGIGFPRLRGLCVSALVGVEARPHTVAADCRALARLAERLLEATGLGGADSARRRAETAIEASGADVLAVADALALAIGRRPELPALDLPARRRRGPFVAGALALAGGVGAVLLVGLGPRTGARDRVTPAAASVAALPPTPRVPARTTLTAQVASGGSTQPSASSDRPQPWPAAVVTEAQAAALAPSPAPTERRARPSDRRRPRLEPRARALRGVVWSDQQQRLVTVSGEEPRP